MPSILIALTVSCTTSNPPTTLASDTRKIESLHEAWVAKVGSSDLDGLLALVADDAVFWAASQPAVVGRDGVRNAYAQAFTTVRVRQAWESEELIVSGAWAIDRGLEHVTVESLEDGATLSSGVRRAITILHRGPDGVWRYARGLSVPMGTTPGAGP